MSTWGLRYLCWRWSCANQCRVQRGFALEDST